MTSSTTNHRVFGQATRGRLNAPTRYKRQQGLGGRGQNQNEIKQMHPEEQELTQRRFAARAKRKVEDEALDGIFGVSTYSRSSIETKKRGWIYNILPTTMTTSDDQSPSDSNGLERSGLELYCLEIDGSTFKTTVLYDPYFYVIADPPQVHNSPHLHDGDDHDIFFETLLSTLVRKYEPIGLKNANVVRKLDLDAVNHLSVEGSKGRHMLKLSFDTVQQLMEVRRDLQPLIERNKKKDFDRVQFFDYIPQSKTQDHQVDPLSTLIDLREYDVPYPVRVCIDLSIRVGAWYTFTPNDKDSGVTLSEQDIETKANPKFLAFDIECTKAPLKFPDASVDSIYMISYMVDGQGYLILSRHIVGKDVGNFEYTPKPSYPGPFIVYNELTEENLILRFLDEYQRLRPQIVVTYNGDFFDWPFLEQRCAVYGIDLRQKIGIERVNGTNLTEGEYRGRSCVHLDAFCWVRRDSYLPQGSQGLKAVTRYKLGYDPVEVDPEDMVKYARERPIHMASYSVSDAVATYYLYEKYVHMFIFSLATIIPMGPEDVLRKGSGTLCEALLMVQACTKDIICPNKQVEPLTKFHQGHLLESETYIGGKVECLETGVFRSDVEYEFDLKSSAFQQLIDNVDRDLTFAIEVEGGIDRNTVTNYDEIRCQIIEQLELLRDRPVRTERPYVYHLDVGAMYPNIILTNRLQPSAIVDDSTCAACDFNQAKNNCKRQMNWVWRGDYNPASKGEYERTKDQLSREKIADGRYFYEVEGKEQADLVSSRLKQYSKNAYKKTKVTEEITRTDTVCMRENDFYVDTVRQFRDKRYELKKLTKKWGQKVKAEKDALLRKEAADRTLVYDSLQVAHKCILNSFYGYVMRKGARWRSMEMAGIVTKTGADLITQARILVEQIGRPLELDTDGIWCILPQSFPDVFFFKQEDGSKLKLEYPCVMLNADVHDNFTNDQYQTLKDNGKQVYETRSENSIFFEVDGPYRCMVLPSSTEEGKLLKKRYAVFNFDGTLAELKGFELKRRGELELIKTFQSQVFERFLNGNSLVECYDSVAEIANHWLDVLDTQGDSLETDELVDLISENRSMSRQLDDYGDQKGTSQTTARRLGEFLGAEIIKDKGLNCKFIIAERPHGAPVTERAIPTAIWKSETAVMKHYLRKWLKSPGMVDEDFNIRNVLDWDYYRERLGKTIQKIITIPAALQKVPNPVPRIPHPDWLQRTVRRLNDRYQQKRITSMFRKVEKHKNEVISSTVVDIEDTIGRSSEGDSRPVIHVKQKREFERSVSDTLPNDPTHYSNAERDKKDKKNHSKVLLTSDTFQAWLESKKKEWGFSAKRKRNIPDVRNRSDSGKMKKQRRTIGTMSGYIRDAASSLASFEWHIVEIRELSSSENGFSTSSSGDFVVWVMLGNGSLQKLQVSMPRTIYLNCREKINEITSKMLTVRLVEKFLPHNKTSNYLYEVTIPEHTFQRKDWIQKVVRSPENANTVESFYEMNSPLSLKSVMHLGCICRANLSLKEKNTNYQLSDLKRVEKPTEGEYLHEKLSYKRIVFHERLQNSSKIGLVAIFIQDETDQNVNIFNLTAKCHVWVVKPGSKQGQRNISTKSCESMFSQLLGQVLQLSTGEIDSEYTRLSPDSHCKMQVLTFVDEEMDAFSQFLGRGKF